MPLDKQYTSVALTSGIDTKTDPKQVEPPHVLTADNVMYMTEKMFRKRYGYTVIDTYNGNAVPLPRTLSSILTPTGAEVVATDDFAVNTAPIGGAMTPQSATAPVGHVALSKVPLAANAPSGTPPPPVGAAWYPVTANEVYIAWNSGGSIVVGVWDSVNSYWAQTPTVQANAQANAGGDCKWAFEPISGTLALTYPAYNGGGTYWAVYAQNFVPSSTVGGSPYVITQFTAAGAASTTSTQGYDFIVHNGTLYFIATATTAACFISKVTLTAGLITLVTTFTTQASTNNRCAAATGVIGGSAYLGVASTKGQVDFYDGSGTLLGTFTQTSVLSNIVCKPIAIAITPKSFSNKSGGACIVAMTTAPGGGHGQRVSAVNINLSSGGTSISATDAVVGWMESSYSTPVLSAMAVDADSNVYFWYGASSCDVKSTQTIAYLVQGRQAHLASSATAIPRWMRVGQALAQATGEVLTGVAPGTAVLGRVSGLSLPLGGTNTWTGPWAAPTWLLSELTQLVFPAVPYSLSAYRGRLAALTATLNPGLDAAPVATDSHVVFPSAAPVAYDGAQTFPTGFSIGPDMAGLTANTRSGSGGSLHMATTYTIEACYVYQDGQGNIYRSAPGSAITATTGAGSDGTWDIYFSTTDPMPFSTVPNSYIEIYAAAAGNVNRYLVQQLQSALTTTIDFVALNTANLGLYTTNSGEIENDAAPASNFMLKTQNRLFAVSSEDPTIIYYTKPFVANLGPQWSLLLTYQMPRPEAVTGMASQDGVILIFTQNRVYVLPGDGPDATGSGGWNTLTSIPLDSGCTDPASIVTTTDGTYFKGQRGIVLINRSLTPQYVGLPVDTYTETVVATLVVAAQQHIRFYTASGKTLVYDYIGKRWSTFSGQPMRSVALLNYTTIEWFPADRATLRQEAPGTFTDDGAAVQMTIETPWIKMAGAQGWGRLYRAAVLGDFKSAHTMTVSLAYDYQSSYTDSVPFTTSSGLINGDTVYQFRMSRVPRQVMQAVKLRLQDSSTTGESCDISTITLEVGQKAGVAKLPSQKTV